MLYGYANEGNLFWDGLRGPLNLLIIILGLMPVAAFLRIIGCKCLRVTISRKINLAAEAFMCGAFDRLFTIAQL
jgi:hypothetical protein